MGKNPADQVKTLLVKLDSIRRSKERGFNSSKYSNVFLPACAYSHADRWLIPLIAGRLPPLKVRDLRLDLAIPPQAGLIFG